MAGELVVSTINGAGFDIANVIINPEFTLNQRGAASRTAATGYNFDRWYYDGSKLLQGVEGNNLRAGTYVLSWSGSSTAEFSLNTAAASGQGSESYTAVTNGGTITIASVGSNNLWVRFSSDLTNLTRVKLSPGTEASGFVARPYGAELALCQRYFLPVTLPADTNAAYPATIFIGGASVLLQTLPVQASMRAAPTVTTFIGTAVPTFYRYDAGASQQRTVTTLSVGFRGGSNPYSLEIQYTGAGAWGSAGYIGSIAWSVGTNSVLNLSAEL